MTHDKRQYEKGYYEQSAWLRREALGLEEARYTLVSREGTVTDDPFNKGGDDATRAYIKRLESGHAPQEG